MNVSIFRLLAVAVVLLLLTGTSDKNSRVFASSPGFEIPISDLKKVEKKKQRKSEGRRNRESKKSKKSDAEKTASPATPTTSTPTATTGPAITTPQTTTTPPVTTEKTVGIAPSTTVETVAPAVPVAPVASPPQPSVTQPETKPTPEKTASAPSVTIEPATAKPAGNTTAPSLPPEEEEYRISHEPFSYLVAGKMTKLMAVVISKNDVLTMRCRFRAGEKGQYGEIEMLLAPGSKFTYSAVIPALIPGAMALYYEFVLTDNQGKKFRSQEYRIPLNATAVVPGWQYGLSQARINVLLENQTQPFEGFIGITAGENQKQ